MSQVKELADENEALKKLVAELQENLKGYEKDYDEIVNENDDLRAQLSAYKAEEKEEESYDDEEEAEEEEKVSEEDKEEAEEKEEEKADDSEEQALAIAKALRSLGAEPVVTKPKARALSKEEVLEKFASIADPKERAQFYANHRNIIFN